MFSTGEELKNCGIYSKVIVGLANPSDLFKFVFHSSWGLAPLTIHNATSLSFLVQSLES